jgi:hypothetical protein
MDNVSKPAEVKHTAMSNTKLFSASQDLKGSLYEPLFKEPDDDTNTFKCKLHLNGTEKSNDNAENVPPVGSPSVGNLTLISGPLHDTANTPSRTVAEAAKTETAKTEAAKIEEAKTVSLESNPASPPTEVATSNTAGPQAPIVVIQNVIVSRSAAVTIAAAAPSTPVLSSPMPATGTPVQSAVSETPSVAQTPGWKGLDGKIGDCRDIIAQFKAMELEVYFPQDKTAEIEAVKIEEAKTVSLESNPASPPTEVATSNTAGPQAPIVVIQNVIASRSAAVTIAAAAPSTPVLSSPMPATGTPVQSAVSETPSVAQTPGWKALDEKMGDCMNFIAQLKALSSPSPKDCTPMQKAPAGIMGDCMNFIAQLKALSSPSPKDCTPMQAMPLLEGEEDEAKLDA